MTELSGPLAPPNLGSVITSADVDKKDSGSYAADYVNWCRTAQLLRENAPGWQFHLRPTADGQHVWQAPNGTGYVVGFFVGPDGSTTPDFPQAVMDNRNAAVPLAKVDARDLTDTHRRCLCTAAAAQFGLAWQLWAKEPVENPHRESDPAPAKPAARGAAPTRQALAAKFTLAQNAANDARVTLATANKRCREAGLTEAGVAAMAQDLSKGSTTVIAGLSADVQRKLATAGVSDASVAKWNAAGAAQTDDDPDLPATWDGPTAA